MKLKLEQLFAQYGVQSITTDSRYVPENCVFMAIRGASFDGNQFIADTLAKGATIALTDNPDFAYKERVFYVADIKEAIRYSIEIIYPIMPDNIIAVTGTNGKSSVVSYVHQMLDIMGQGNCSVGTLGIECSLMIDDLRSSATGLTTMDAVRFRHLLHNLKKHNINYISFEASSHGIVQGRLSDLKASTAAFTSFSQDHLDYHGDMENYLQAKLKLFKDYLTDGGIAVINSDIAEYSKITHYLNEHKVRYISVGSSQGSDVIFKILTQTVGVQQVELIKNGLCYQFTTNIIGSFQACNLIIAVQLLENLGFDFATMIAHLPKLVAVKGRLQRIGSPDDDIQVFVDYAHTPDALEKSLSELRRLLEPGGRLHVIFGCGGDRDKSKRPIMGAVANHLADIVVITDDNPRTEDPAEIKAQIAAAAPKASIASDRKTAIIDVVNSMFSKDILLISGKGHEEYQIIGSQTNYFSDIEIAKEAVINRKNK